MEPGINHRVNRAPGHRGNSNPFKPPLDPLPLHGCRHQARMQMRLMDGEQEKLIYMSEALALISRISLIC